MILFLSCLLLVGVGYSIYKMVGAFSAERSSPAYERTPSPAFALPQADTIVEPQNLNQARLPDEVAVQLAETTKRLTGLIAERKLSTASLKSAGAHPDAAKAMVDMAKRNYSAYSGRQLDLDSEVTTRDVTSDGAVLAQGFSYGPGASGVPGGSVVVIYGYGRKGGDWVLQSMEIDPA